MTDTTGQRGLRVVAVIDQSVSSRHAATLLAGRLRDELPPEWVRVFSVGQPMWERALGLESAMAASLEPGAIVWPEGYDSPAPMRDLPDIEQLLADVGVTASASWSPWGWRATLRRSVGVEVGGDLVLAVSGRRRPLPCGLHRRHRVEALVPPA